MAARAKPAVPVSARKVLAKKAAKSPVKAAVKKPVAKAASARLPVKNPKSAANKPTTKPAAKAAAKAAAKKKPVVASKRASAPLDAIQAGKWVYSFGGGKAEGKAGLRNLLGGKGANLAEMANLGLPVPPGFTIPT